jgi:hypothetical protein
MEVLYKSREKLTAAWNSEPSIEVLSYNVYVGVVPVLTSLTLLKEGVPAYLSDTIGSLKKVACEVNITEVRTVLGLASTVDFSSRVFYFAITYVDALGESAIADSILVELHPQGIGPKTRNCDNPMYERFCFGFCDDIQKWIKLQSTINGGLIISPSDFHKANITTEYTYDGTNLATMKSYPSDMTAAGAPAKLTAYSYTGSAVTKVIVTDSTV